MALDLNGNILMNNDITSTGVFKSKINTEGLILYLDGANINSYPGSGEFWYDLSDNEYYLGLTGATISNGYATFNGSSDYIKTNDVIVDSPLQLTIGGWFSKSTGGSTYECVLHQSSDTSIGNSSYWFGVDSSDNITATIGARTGVGWAAGQTTTTVTYDTWYFVCATWNGEIVKVYINGVYNKEYLLSTYSSLTTPTRIGASSDGASYQFSGKVGIIYIYNRGLNPYEIAENFQADRNRFGL